MNIMHLWVRDQVREPAFLLLLLLGLSVGFPAGAQTLPSSTSTENFGSWNNMHVNVYTSDTLGWQCRSTIGEKSWITHSLCSKLLRDFESGNYTVVWANNIKFDIMRGRVGGNPAGEPKAWHNQHMLMDESKRALLFDLGDGIYAYFFTGQHGVSCNNVGFVLQEKPKPPVVVVVPPADVAPEPEEETCRFVKREVVKQPDLFTFLPAMNSCGCFAPGVSSVVQGGTQTSSQMVCD